MTAESWRTRLVRWRINWYPAFFGTGARLTFLAADWSEARLSLPLSWRTRNLVGTIYGGSMYGSIDPIYMILLIRRLGPGYVVWDKAASIRFRRPGRTTLFATFRLDDERVAAIRSAADAQEKVEPEFTVELVDAAGEVHATCQKLLSVRRRPPDA